MPYDQLAPSTRPTSATFRDPAGSLEITPHAVIRTVKLAHTQATHDLLALPLAARLVQQQRLIASEILPNPDSNPNAPLRLRHPRIPFVSYPWEWPPALWLSAAELTLNLASELVNDGWILKDATPLNVLFQGTQPIFVDLLSIQRANLTQPIWFAYGQFVRMFLLPMLTHAQLGWPLHATLSHRDGYEPEDVYQALSLLARLRQPALSAITLPLLLSRKAKSSAAATPRKPTDPALTTYVLRKTFARLLADMRRVTPKHRPSTWSDYAETAHHYSHEDHAGKQAFVTAALHAARPTHLLDVGCNTGVYSRLAAHSGAHVVAIDTDLQAVDRLATSLIVNPANILPLCVDLAHPTPATGWSNQEYPAFLTRCAGHFDTVLMLAVIHHLLLRAQIPLPHIAALCSRITTRHLILEWVPPTDPKFQELLRGREAIYTHITEAAFRKAFDPYFDILRETTLANGRILFHFLRNPTTT